MYNQEERIRLEQMIIGAILIERDCFEDVKDILSYTDFLKPHNIIFTAFIKLFEAKEPIDLRTVYRLLEKNNQDVSAHYLVECTQMVNSSANIKYHSFILLQLKLEDDMVNICRPFTSVNSIDAQLASNCLKKITEYTDQLKTLDLIASYLHTRSPESQLTKKIIILNQKFTKKCQKIRQNQKK